MLNLCNSNWIEINWLQIRAGMSKITVKFQSRTIQTIIPHPITIQVNSKLWYCLCLILLNCWWDAVDQSLVLEAARSVTSIYQQSYGIRIKLFSCEWDLHIILSANKLKWNVGHENHWINFNFNSFKWICVKAIETGHFIFAKLQLSSLIFLWGHFII